MNTKFSNYTFGFCNPTYNKSQVDFAVSMNYTKKQLDVLKDVLKDQIQGDFAKADIYFNSLNVQTMAEEIKYTVAERRRIFSSKSFIYSCISILSTQAGSYLSGLGGSISLYLGIAVIMIFELLELAFDLILNSFRK